MAAIYLILLIAGRELRVDLFAVSSIFKILSVILRHLLIYLLLSGMESLVVRSGCCLTCLRPLCRLFDFLFNVLLLL